MDGTVTPARIAIVAALAKLLLAALESDEQEQLDERSCAVSSVEAVVS